mgnify:CR=1 FL=1
MSDPTIVEAVTNTQANSCVEVKCDCNTMWSLVQQMSYLRLSTPTGEYKAKLVENYAVRARRIAGTYARFYLELEDGSEVGKKGRFYWMALGAFASKTVACTYEAWQVKAMSATISKTTKEGLGKGNFWLFCDISAWHWYYIKYGNTFDQCLDSRNAANYVSAVKSQMNKLPWKTDALPKIKQMVVSKEIKAGFDLVKKIEQEGDIEERRKLQLNHLLAIADHEQGVILQPLIYNDPDFAWWVQTQRSAWVNWATPNLELVFSHACSTDKAQYKSVAPKDIKLEEFDSRMKWIGDAAKKFHRLMRTDTTYMEAELRAIATWAQLADK